MARPYIMRKGVSRINDLAGGAMHYREDQVFYVDSVNGSDGNDGFTPDTAFATMDKGIDQARYKPGTTTIDDTKSHNTLVLVAPGHYNESLLFSGYNITVEGMIAGRPGKDYGVSVNYDGATSATAALAFSGSGICVRNLHIYCDAAIPALYIAGGDNNLVENVVIEGDGSSCTYGIHCASLKGSVIKDCVIQGFVTAGIWMEGGADRYAIHGGIENCQLHSDASGADGILFDSNIVAYNFRIHQNFIDVQGGGAGAIGIDINDTGNTFVTDNYIACHTSPITCAGNGSLHNHVTIQGDADDVYDDDDA